MAGTLKNFYETLGVSRSATTEQIKEAYRKLILKFHPDKNVGDAYFEEWSKKIIEAFEVLSDPQLRAEYDQVYDEHKSVARKHYEEQVHHRPPEPEPAAESEKEATVHEEAMAEETDGADAAQEEEPPAADPEPEEQEQSGGSPFANERKALNDEIPEYIRAKQEYLRARRSYKPAGTQKTAGPANSGLIIGVITCLVLIAGSVYWLINQPETVEEKVTPVPDGVVLNVSELFVVGSEKAYFYKDPQNQVRMNEYLTKGNKVTVSKKYGDFYFAEFQSIANPDYKLTGWLNQKDLQPN